MIARYRTARTACLAVIVSLLAAPTLAAQAPGKAIGKDTTLAVWLDVKQISPEMIQTLGKSLGELAGNPMIQDQAAGLPLGDIKQMADGLTTFRNGFVQAGGEGLLLTLGPLGDAADDAWMPPVSMLAKAGGDGLDAASMNALFNTMGEGELDTEVVSIGGGWHDVSMVSKEGEAVTLALPEPHDAALQAFNKQLGAVEKPVLSLAFRMQDDMRQALDLDPQQAGAQQDPNMAMVLGMLTPLKSLDTVGLSVSMVNETDFKVDVRMAFFDAQQAAMFMNMYNTIMMLAPAILAQQLQGVPDAPDPNQLNQFFMKLSMQANGDTLSLTLDPEFFEMAERIGPLLEGMGQPELIQ